MIKQSACVTASLLLLAACNKGPEVHEKDASVTEVAQKVRQAGGDQSFVRPGLWQSKVTINKVEVPGAPPEMAAAMQGKTSEERTYCLTPEEAKKPNENFFAGNRDECRYDHFTMSGGKIDAAMRCTHEQMTQQIDFAGSYTPDAYQMAMDTKVAGGPREMAGMSMSMRVESKRVGECSAKQG